MYFIFFFIFTLDSGNIEFFFQIVGVCGKYDRITANDKTTKNSDIPDSDYAVARSYAVSQGSVKASDIPSSSTLIDPSDKCEKFISRSKAFDECRSAKKV